MGRIVIIGATSGIGKELAEIFSYQGNAVGLVGRREALLYKIADELPNKSYIKAIDISVADKAMEQLEELLMEMGEVDTIVVSAGVGHFNSELDCPTPFVLQIIKFIKVVMNSLNIHEGVFCRTIDPKSIKQNLPL